MRRMNTLKIMMGVGAMGVAGLVSCNAGVFSTPVSALSYQDSAEMQFTFNPTISVSLSSPDLIISNLTPGSASDSNIVTATVSTNAGWGYYLAATTGTAGGTTNLVNTTDNTAVFTSLASNVATVSAMPDNSWGYSYSTDNGTTWVSGNSGSTTAGYNGLPLDADDNGATGIKLLSSNTLAASGSVQFKIGAHAGTTQAAGTYTGTVNFYAVTNPGPDNTMQGFAAGDASTTCSAMSTGDTIKLKDSRDDTEYTVGKLADGKCWMLDNLALDLTEATVRSNLNSATTNSIDHALACLLSGSDGGTTCSEPFSSSPISDNWSDEYGKPRIDMSKKDTISTDALSVAGGWKTGGYYNYCAASGGFYCFSSASDYSESYYDICPKGWRMPTGGSNGEYITLAKIITGTESGNGEKALTFRNALRLPVSGGRGFTNEGRFWTRTRFSNYGMNILSVENDSFNVGSGVTMIRSQGLSVRCILGS